MGVTETGPWDEVVKLQDSKHVMSIIESELKPAQQRAGLRGSKVIKEKIASGPGPALSGFTVAMKGSSKQLIDKADLLGAVSFSVLDTFNVFVGVLKQAHGSGLGTVNIGLLQEQGTTIRVTDKMRNWFFAQGVHLRNSTIVIVIPGRPFVKPSEEKVREAAEEEYSLAMEKIAGKIL